MDLSSKQGRRQQGLRIQRAVERSALSIEELAGRIGCSRALIYQYLAGTTLAQPDRLQQIALQCGVPLTYFYETADSEDVSVATALPVSDVVIPPARPEADPSSVSAPSKPLSPAPSADVSLRMADSVLRLQELANAQNSPPDYGELSSTCERILTLAAQMEDRTALARAQLLLGNARLRMADFSRAADALQQAITFARQAGDLQTETSASQSLGNALVALGRAEEARTHFARIAGGTLFQGQWQGTLSLGCIHEQFGEYQQAMQRFDEAAALLEEGQAIGKATASEVAEGLLYVNANRVNVYMDGGDFSGARPLAQKCLADAEALGNADQHLEARFNLAWCDYHVGRLAGAYHGLTGVIQLARLLGDVGRETLARAWLAILLAAIGEHEDALETGKDALATALSRGDRRAELYAQLALSDVYTATKRNGEARYHSNQALAVAIALRMERAESECRLRVARLSIQAGDWREAYEAASHAVRVARRIGARHLEGPGLFWLAAALFYSSDASGNPKVEAETAGARSTFSGVAFPADASSGSPSELCMEALSLARELGLVEVIWRGEDLLSQIAMQGQPADAREAEARSRSAAVTLDTMRSGIVEAGLTDALLENEDCLGVYERHVRGLMAQGRAAEGRAVLEQAGWPPLEARFPVDGPQATDS